MRVICSYCREDLGRKEPLNDERITHGMCVACADRFVRQWEGQRLGEYLDRFECPVLAFNAEGRIVAVNAHMEAMLGKNAREILGYLGGEVMECRYARLEGGCGQTQHCEACTIRRTVMATHETGEPQSMVTATITRDDDSVQLVISTCKAGDIVRLTIELAENI